MARLGHHAGRGRPGPAAGAADALDRTADPAHLLVPSGSRPPGAAPGRSGNGRPAGPAGGRARDPDAVEPFRRQGHLRPLQLHQRRLPAAVCGARRARGHRDVPGPVDVGRTHPNPRGDRGRADRGRGSAARTDLDDDRADPGHRRARRRHPALSGRAPADLLHRHRRRQGRRRCALRLDGPGDHGHGTGRARLVVRRVGHPRLLRPRAVPPLGRGHDDRVDPRHRRHGRGHPGHERRRGSGTDPGRHLHRLRPGHERGRRLPARLHPPRARTHGSRPRRPPRAAGAGRRRRRRCRGHRDLPMDRGSARQQCQLGRDRRHRCRAARVRGLRRHRLRRRSRLPRRDPTAARRPQGQLRR